MRTIALTQGYSTHVDDEDYERVAKYKWCAHPGRVTVYALRSLHVAGKTKTQYLHRFILEVTDSSVQVDHKDHNGLNNCRSNLRQATHADNMRNRKDSGKPKGVRRISKNSWSSRISVDHKEIHLGSFPTELAAICAYNVAAEKYFGDFAHINEEAKWQS